MSSAKGIKLIEDDDEDINEHTTQAFERQYLDERSWENLVERDGRLVSIQAASIHRKRSRINPHDSRVRRGMIRSAPHLWGLLAFKACSALGSRAT